MKRGHFAPDPPAPPRRTPSRGFTLVEVIVALAIMVMIAATVMPSVIGTIDRERQQRAYDTIVALIEAMDDYRADVGFYPRNLSYLTTPVVGTDQNSCGQAIGNTRAGLWQGPYDDRAIPTTGLPVFVGTTQNTLVRTPTTGGPNPTLAMRISDVLLIDAEALDIMFDGAVSSTTGLIRWGAVTDGRVTLEYVQLISPVSAC